MTPANPPLRGECATAETISNLLLIGCLAWLAFDVLVVVVVLLLGTSILIGAL